MKKFIVMSMILTAFVVNAHASQAQEEACSDDSTAGMLECGSKRLELADKDLNITYRETMSKARAFYAFDSRLQTEFLSRLKAAEKAWIVFRDAQCELDAAVEGLGGSIERVVNLSCLIEQTEKRTDTLKQILSSLEGDAGTK